MAIQFRRGNQEDLVESNLLPAEPAYCLDTGRLVIGDGEGGADIIATGAEAEAIANNALSEQKGQPNGIATLNAEGIVPTAQTGIVSSGNTDGHYVKHPDGRMECYGVASSSSGDDIIITFPESFIDSPFVYVQSIYTPGSGPSALIISTPFNISTTGFRVYVRHASGTDITWTSTVHWRAIGRWK
jgi:hypothetical protein